MTTQFKQRLGSGGFAWPDSDDSRQVGRSLFLEEVRRREPGVLANLADMAGLDERGRFEPSTVSRAALEEWGKRWNLSDRWCLDIADATVKTWQGPTGDLLHEPFPVGQGPFRDRNAVVAALDWLYPVAVEANPLDDDEERIPALDAEVMSWNPRHESWEQAETRMTAAFHRHIRAHRDQIQALAETAGLERTTSRTARHFRWLAMYQVQRLPKGERFSYRTLAKVERVEMQSIEQALKETAELIGLTLRKGKGGRPRKATARTVRPILVR